MYNKVTLRRFHVIIVAAENQLLLHVLSICILALVIGHAKRMASLALKYFSTLSHKRHDFFLGGGVIERKMCVLISSTTFVRNISDSKKNSARY